MVQIGRKISEKCVCVAQSVTVDFRKCLFVCSVIKHVILNTEDEWRSIWSLASYNRSNKLLEQYCFECRNYYQNVQWFSVLISLEYAQIWTKIISTFRYTKHRNANELMVTRETRATCAVQYNPGNGWPAHFIHLLWRKKHNKPEMTPNKSIKITVR